MDITKDRLYCEAKDSQTRRATQSAMAHISKSMLALIAPTLTYTADEILDFAPDLFKEGLEDVFDLVYTPVPEVEASFDDSMLIEAREKFFEAIDSLKKEKVIKATLELEIAGDVSSLPIKDTKDLEDWFVVSAIKESSDGEQVASFEVDGKNFSVHKATAHKCPRCWRFASSAEDEVCPRCQEVVS